MHFYIIFIIEPKILAESYMTTQLLKHLLVTTVRDLHLTSTDGQNK